MLTVFDYALQIQLTPVNPDAVNSELSVIMLLFKLSLS